MKLNLIHNLVIFCLLVLLGFIVEPASAQWLRTSQKYGGCRSLVMSGTKIFAGLYGEGIWLTNDNGNNWKSANMGMTNTFITAIVRSGKNLFVATEVDDLNGGLGCGVFISTNEGTNWSKVSSGLTDSNVYTLGVSGNNLFAGTDNGVFLSTNNGASWIPTSSGLQHSYVRTLVVSGNNLFAGTDRGVFLSTDSGANWILTGLSNAYVHILFTRGTILFAGITGKVLRSSDSGNSWIEADSGLKFVNNVSTFVANDSNIFAGTDGYGIFLSTNNGASWTSVNSGLTSSTPSYNIESLGLIGTNLFAGTADGIWRRPLSEIQSQDVVILSPTKEYIIRNYPNPFSQSTTVEMTSDGGYVKVSVMNELGKKITSLYTGILDAGQHSFIWNTEGVASGIYEFIIEQGGKVEHLTVLRRH